MDGSGDVLVSAVGENSQWGQAKKLIEGGKEEKTPL